MSDKPDVYQALAVLYALSLGERSTLAPCLAVLPPPDDLDHPLLWAPSECASLLQFVTYGITILLKG